MVSRKTRNEFPISEMMHKPKKKRKPCAPRTWKRTGGKTGGRDFKPGCPPGPGRAKVPEDQKLAWIEVQGLRSKARYLWSSYFDELIGLSFEELRAMVGYKDGKRIVPPADPSLPVLKLAIARGIFHAAIMGSALTLETLKELMCGPEPKQIELSGRDGEPLNPMANAGKEQLALAWAALEQATREIECQSTQNPQPSSASPVPLLPPPSDTAS